MDAFPNSLKWEEMGSCKQTSPAVTFSSAEALRNKLQTMGCSVRIFHIIFLDPVGWIDWLEADGCSSTHSNLESYQGYWSFIGQRRDLSPSGLIHHRRGTPCSGTNGVLRAG